MARLVKHRHASGNDSKYYIQCQHWSDDSSSIEVNELIKTNTNIAILRAIATDDTIRKNNRHIVVKIGRESTHMIEHEYDIGLRLHWFSGFIKFLCLFPCFDDTSKKNTETKEDEAPRPMNTPICQANSNRENRKQVLVMPYIHDGSLLQYNWTSKTTDLLKCLLVHTMLSLANAFVHTGFLHGDIHWGNVLFKRTTQQHIIYDIQLEPNKVPTCGFKVVIMDFEKSNIGNTDIGLFWEDLLFFVRRSIQKNKQNELIDWECEELMKTLRKFSSEKTPISKISDIIILVEQTIFKFVPIRIQTYNPNAD